ncbi:hypothetical protein SLS56_006267 [Neofusicoccum ribis]|uniref:ZZ-type domain-containing protein n=1 Tax=Neofusicoccum ribis TaxID=45134 RepID=A0ABR3SS56_9PEZI
MPACRDEDLCNGCKEAGKKRSHPLVPLEPGVEMHDGVFCDGCGRSPIYGTRSVCQKHRDEDWCGDCRRSGRACEGPFEELRQSPHHGSLPPAVATYHILDGNGAGWLEPPDSLCWMPMPARARADSAVQVQPAFTAEITKKGGNFRDRTYAWTFKRGGDGTKLWRYSLESDRKTGTVVLSEHFGPCSAGGEAPLPRFQFAHGPRCDSLVFAAPGGTQYRWLTNRPVSALGGDRWGAQRYILLQLSPAGGGEQVVADHAWWDGHPDAPEDCMAVRSAALDHGLALATLTALIDRQWKCLAAERQVDPAAFEAAVQQARLTPLGRQMYWMAGDAQAAGSGGGGHGKLNAHTIEAVGGLIDATAALVDASGGGGGGDGGGGGGDGGGGGGAAC